MPRTPAPTRAEPANCRGEAPLLSVETGDEAEAEEDAALAAELAREDAELRTEEALPVTLERRELSEAVSVADPAMSL